MGISWEKIWTNALLLGASASLLITPLGIAQQSAKAVGSEWITEGSVEWHTNNHAGGDLKSMGATGGWLVNGQSYEDFLLRFQFRPDNAPVGLMFRRQKDASGGTEGIYVSLSGADIGSAYRVKLDGKGQEIERHLLSIPHNDDDEFKVRFPTATDGWSTVELDVRADALVETINGYRLRTIKMQETAPAGQGRFGQLAFGLSGNAANLGLREISIEDLTERAALPPEITEPPFRQRKVSDLFYDEGVAAGDINHDGQMDVVAGPFYYLGPDFKVAREIYPSATYNVNSPPYTDSFMDFIYDFNGDGWPDVLKVNFDGAYLYINPRGERRHWDVFEVVKGVDSETTQFVDINGDGRPELIMSHGMGAETKVCIAEADWSNPTKPWNVQAISEAGDWGHHGMGVGDINGDGRKDIILATGWWEQPPAGSKELWKYHPAQFGGGPWTEMEGTWSGGSDILVYDVNGDGLPDIVTSLGAHAWGLAWFEQSRDAKGTISWKRHIIMGNPADPNKKDWEETDKSVTFSELHAVALADINGDGLADIITGKRWWSHGDNFSGPDAQAPPVLYWFQLVRKPGGKVQWIPHLINNNTGVGTQIEAIDLNGDGKPDILTSARKGTSIFFNTSK